MILLIRKVRGALERAKIGKTPAESVYCLWSTNTSSPYFCFFLFLGLLLIMFRLAPKGQEKGLGQKPQKGARIKKKKKNKKRGGGGFVLQEQNKGLTQDTL